MIIIYDFDGTLTPYSLAQYEILIKNGYNDEVLDKRVKTKMKKIIVLYIKHIILHIKKF